MYATCTNTLAGSVLLDYRTDTIKRQSYSVVISKPSLVYDTFTLFIYFRQITPIDTILLVMLVFWNTDHKTSVIIFKTGPCLWYIFSCLYYFVKKTKMRVYATCTVALVMVVWWNTDLVIQCKMPLMLIQWSSQQTTSR